MNVADKLLTIAENSKKVYDAGYNSALENPPSPLIMDGRKKLQYFYQDLVDWESFSYDDELGDYVEIVEPIDEVPFPKGTQNIVDFTGFANYSCISPYGDEVWMGLPAKRFTGTLDCSSATTLYSAFEFCDYLETIDNIINTSNVKDWGRVFHGCVKLKSVCELDLSSAENVRNMFYYCKELENVSLVNVPPLTSYSNMFSNCTKLASFPTLDFSKTTDFQQMFLGCRGLVTAPSSIGISNAKSMKMNYMFSYCSSLKTIPCITVNNTTEMWSMFKNCLALENITFEGIIGLGISVADSPLLTHDSLMSIINALETKTSGTFRIVLGGINLAKLSEAEKQIIIDKGWTVS